MTPCEKLQKDKAIAEIWLILMSNADKKAAADALYSAGYRKPQHKEG